jgi:hypothetical protein
VVSLTLAHAQPAEAAFTSHTSSSSTFRAKSYTPITIGRAGGFAALAATSVTNGSTFNTSITGTVGVTPGRTVTGFWPWDVTGGTELDTASARAAMADAKSVAVALRERPTTRRLTPALSGTLTPGVYESTTGAFSLAGGLVLDAKGDASARFVFFTSGNLTLAQRSAITLTGGAQADNVWWVVGGTLTAGSSTFTRDTTAVGNFIAAGAVTLRGTTVTGRVVSRSAAVSLAATQISLP